MVYDRGLLSDFMHPDTQPDLEEDPFYSSQGWRFSHRKHSRGVNRLTYTASGQTTTKVTISKKIVMSTINPIDLSTQAIENLEIIQE